MLIHNQKLSLLQQQDLEKLTSLCLAADGGLPRIYHDLLNQQRETESNFLYYQYGVLIGFASVYFFYEQACEVSLMVAPKQRQQRVARELIKAMLPLLYTRGMKRVLFSLSGAVQHDWALKLAFTYHNSEYHMCRGVGEEPVFANPSLTVREAVLSDLPVLLALDQACFPGQGIDMTRRFTQILLNPDYHILVAEIDGQVVGKAHLRQQMDSVLLSDIAISPSRQGKGLGRELLAHCIRDAQACGLGSISLDVETDKTNALNLYLKQGFKIVNTYEFWEISLEKLAQIFLLP